MIVTMTFLGLAWLLSLGVLRRVLPFESPLAFIATGLVLAGLFLTGQFA